MDTISVVMPVFRCERFVATAVESILAQTYEKIELIIVCDDPSEQLKTILEALKSADPRISLVYQGRRGLIASRNICCQLASGKYIAMMDCDDISHPERLQIQYEFLDSHPDVGLVGTWYDVIDESGIQIDRFNSLTGADTLRWMFFFGNYIGHSTVMMRRETLEKVNFYDISLPGVSEDYALYLKVLEIADVDVIPQYLVRYRKHTHGVTGEKWSEMMAIANDLRKKYIERQIGHPIDRDTVVNMNVPSSIRSGEDLFKVINLIDELFKKYFDSRQISRTEKRAICDFLFKFQAYVAKSCSKSVPIESVIALVLAYYSYNLKPRIYRNQIPSV